MFVRPVFTYNVCQWYRFDDDKWVVVCVTPGSENLCS